MAIFRTPHTSLIVCVADGKPVRFVNGEAEVVDKAQLAAVKAAAKQFDITTQATAQADTK